MSPIGTCLWFDGNGQEAAEFYTSIFPRSRIKDVARYTGAGPGPEGSVMTVSFELDGRNFLALNGGPTYRFTPAISLMVDCESQAEVDSYWDKLLAGGGKPVQCGWLEDRFGISWQVIPRDLPRLLTDPDPVKAERTTKAMLSMVKLDIAALRRAHDGA